MESKLRNQENVLKWILVSYRLWKSLNFFKGSKLEIPW